MDSIGTLDLSWIQGYNGGKVEYITRDVVCYKCGNNIKFVAEDGHESSISSPGDGIGPLAVHGINHVFAFADLSMPPKVFVFQYPSFRTVSELEGEALLSYSYLCFSSSDYLATISGVPDFKLTIWKYADGIPLCSQDFGSIIPESVTFNPASWRQLCVTSGTDLTVWNIEQSDNIYLIKKQKLQLPPADGSYEDEEPEFDIPTRASTRMTVDLPTTAIAGVRGEEAENFAVYQDQKTRVRPVSHCWTPSGDILVGCSSGQLLKIDGEDYITHILYCPPYTRLGSAMGRVDSALDREFTEMGGESSTSMMQSDTMTEGSFNCLALHKQGLFAAGEDGTLRQLQITNNDQVKVVESKSLGIPVTSLSFNQSHNKMAIGTARGSVQVFDTKEGGTIKTLFDVHFGQYVGMDMLMGSSDICVSVHEDGELQVWNMEQGKLLATLSIGFQTHSLACSPMIPVAVVGTGSGHVYYVDLGNLEEPRIVQMVHVHTGPVTHLVFTDHGELLLSGSDDGHVFVSDGRASKQFQPLGYTEVSGEVVGLAVESEHKSGTTNVVITTNSTDRSTTGATKLTSISLPADILTEKYKQLCASLKYDLKDDAIRKMVFNLAVPSHGVALAPSRTAYTLAHNNRKLVSLYIPTQPPQKSASKDSYLHADAEYPGHDLPGGTIVLSPHQKWIASGGRDGKLAIRATGTLERCVQVPAHDFQSGGVRQVIFTPDGTKMLTTGYDGILNCFKWNFSGSGQSQAKSAMEWVRARQSAVLKAQQSESAALTECGEWTMPGLQSRPGSATEKAEKEKLEKEKLIETAIESDEIYCTPTPTPGSDATWLEVKELEAIKEEDKQYSTVKKDLRMQIRDMRRTLQTLMKENQTIPDIEKLNQHEFDLDIEEQGRLQAEGEMEVQRIREEKEMENLGKLYLTELIKKECWDDMLVKGRGILAFNSNLEVYNYPMKVRNQEEVDRLEEVKRQRMVERDEIAIRKDIVEGANKPKPASVRKAMRAKFKVVDDNDDDLDEDVDDGEEDTKESAATTGSLGVEYGGGSDLFYSQFELHTREQKMNQIILLKDAIYRMKQAYNKEFEEVYQKKTQEIVKIQDRNKRICKILDDLDLPQDVLEPQMGSIEKPEMLLTVQDDEVKVEKFLSEEQQRLADEEDKKDQERKAMERADNWRERGLDMMMGGVLQVKKEDELKKDVLVPLFMMKPEDEWTEDEKKVAQDYDRKVKELQEEREKYRKQLEMELKKLQSLTSEGTQTFDECLGLLFRRKVRTEMTIYQEELKMVRLKYSLLQEEELNNREKELQDELQHKKQLKTMASQVVTETRKQVDAFREQYEILQAEDRVMDRQFKKDFSDVPAFHVDQLYKLYRRRPRGQKARASETPYFDHGSGNPFADRPSTARQNDQARVAMEAALQELDKESNMPEGVESAVWERLCMVRRQKIDSEQLVKQKALVLADMQAFMQQRQQEDEQLREQIEDIITSINKLKEDRMRYTCNLEVQLLLKQGQVEVDAGDFIQDYTVSLLIHRAVVEELNGKIRQLGESKIGSMTDSKEFKKKIVQLEWEHKKMTMQMEDFRKKMKDIQNIKVTREIQSYLNESDHEGKKAQEQTTLEQTIQLLKQHHEKNVNDKKKIIRDLKQTIHEKDDENNDLTQELTGLNVSVNERRHIHQVNADKRSDAGKKKKVPTATLR